MFGWLKQIFAKRRADGDEALIAECRDILAMPDAHPMARYFARLRLGPAEARKAAQDRREADQAAALAARAAIRPSAAQRPGTPHDPAFRQAKGAPPPAKPIPLGHVMPPMPWEIGR